MNDGAGLFGGQSPLKVDFYLFIFVSSEQVHEMT